MASFGSDPSVFLTAEDLIQGSRIVELSSSRNLVAFTQKKFSIKSKSAATNLFIHNSDTRRVKQMTQLEKGGVGNPYFALDLPGVDDSILFLKDGQVCSLSLDGGRPLFRLLSTNHWSKASQLV